MPWNTPETGWIDGAIVGTSDMNAIGEDLNYLKAMPFDNYLLQEGADYSTSSTSFTDIDSSDLALSVTTTGGDLEISFYGSFNINTSAFVYLDVDVDGTRVGLDDGLVIENLSSGVAGRTVGFIVRKSGLSAAAHTIKLQWKVSANTATLYAGAGTSAKDVHGMFCAKEV